MRCGIKLRPKKSPQKDQNRLAKTEWSDRERRELRGFDMTQEVFAERIGISQNYLSTMERGKVEIGAEILLRISREFARSVEWLPMGEG